MESAKIPVTGGAFRARNGCDARQDQEVGASCPPRPRFPSYPCSRARCCHLMGRLRAALARGKQRSRQSVPHSTDPQDTTHGIQRVKHDVHEPILMTLDPFHETNRRTRGSSFAPKTFATRNDTSLAIPRRVSLRTNPFPETNRRTRGSSFASMIFVPGKRCVFTVPFGGDERRDRRE